MFNVPSQFAGSLPFGMFSTQEVPFGLATLQADPNCVLIQDPSQVWGVQDFPPSSYSSDDKLAWGATKNVAWVRRNALIYTDDLTNAAWTKSSTTAPSDGLLQCSAATATHEFRSTTGPITPVVGQTYYLVGKAKQGTWPYVQLACFSGMHGTAYANFDLSTGASGTSTACAPTITGPDGDGYYTITIAVVATGTPSASGFRLSIQQSASDTRQQSWAAAGTETVNIKNIGLYVGSLPSYQAIGADWDTTYTANAIAAGYPISLWQDSAGTKAVNADNQVIGACRDLKYGSYGLELVTSPIDFSDSAKYTLVNATALNSSFTTSGSGGVIFKGVSLDSKWYLCVVTYSKTSGAVSLSIRGDIGIDITSSTDNIKTMSCLVYPTAGQNGVYIRVSGVDTVTITSLSIKEIPGYTAIQATTANQPKWRLDANGKALIQRDGVNDALPVTFQNLGSNCAIYVGEGSTVSEATGQTLNGSYAPLTPAADYGRVIFTTTPSYAAKVVKWLKAKAGY